MYKNRKKGSEMINNIILEFNNKIKFFLLNKFFFNFNRITKKIKNKLTIKK